MTDPRLPVDLTCDEVRDLAASFVLGALDEDEAAAVRAHLATCEDAHAELSELAEVLPALAASVPSLEPSVALKSRIMDAAAADLAARPATQAAAATATAPPRPAAAPTQTASAAPATGSPVPTSFPSADERDARAARSRASAGTWVVRIAAVIAIAVLAGWNLLLQAQLRDSQAYDQQVATVLNVAAQPGSLTVVMAPGAGSARGLAAIDGQGRMTLAMRDLAPLTGGSVYEAWSIAPGAAPVPLGELAIGGNGTAFMEGSGVPPSPGVVVALTQEPGPGANTPTLPIVSSGTATASG
jgi:anti-sigma-K factor RskA